MSEHTRFNTTNRFAKVTDQESSRYALGAVLVTPDSEDKDKVWLTGTNGKVLAIQQTDGKTDKNRLCPFEVIPTQRVGGIIKHNGRWENDKGKFVEQEPEGRFPRCGDVCPEVRNDMLAVCLDAKLLLDLAEAVAKRGRKLDDDDTQLILFLNTRQTEKTSNGLRYVDGAIAVQGANGLGVLMPRTMDRSIDYVTRYNETVESYRKSVNSADW